MWNLLESVEECFPVERRSSFHPSVPDQRVSQQTLAAAVVVERGRNPPAYLLTALFSLTESLPNTFYTFTYTHIIHDLLFLPISTIESRVS